MKNQLKEKIELMKGVLEEDPLYLVIGDIMEETEPVLTPTNDANQDYQDYLNEYSSLRCGSVILFGRKELQQFQFPVADMPGQFEEWVCIGKIDPDPLFISKKNGQICCLVGEPGMEMKITSYGAFNEFLENFVFGERYVEVGGSDKWYDLLKSYKLI
ncbi:hypothetical protein M3661_08085 [Paenibacillus sp. MER 180]|uniref:hypothetical protein n=1 Tax=Paenibacillus sp. MER 180 TaxID=2939570 RepID=UPI0020406900|nr:hypothetical protein [Paenibacillus sp. MER 180]MCM3290086.1 hypothetical protein [Paenibacillus sp. MER 180]